MKASIIMEILKAINGQSTYETKRKIKKFLIIGSIVGVLVLAGGIWATIALFQTGMGLLQQAIPQITQMQAPVQQQVQNQLNQQLNQWQASESSQSSQESEQQEQSEAAEQGQPKSTAQNATVFQPVSCWTAVTRNLNLDSIWTSSLQEKYQDVIRNCLQVIPVQKNPAGKDDVKT